MRQLISVFIILLHINGFSQITDSLQQIVRETKNDSLKAEAIYYLTFQYVNSDLALAKRTNNSHFDLAKSLRSNYAFARVFNAKGVIYDIAGDIDSALYCYKVSLDYAEKSASLLTKASVLNNIGLINWNKGDYETAIKFYSQSLKIFEKIKNQNGIANTQSNIGLIYYDLGDYKKAEEYLFLALNKRLQINDDYGISVSMVNMAMIYEKTKLYSKAIVYLEKSLSYKNKIKDERGMATVYNNLTSLYLKINNHQKAISYANSSLQISKKFNSKLNLIYAYGALVDAYIAKKDFEIATQYIELGISLCKETENKPALIDFFERKETIYYLKGNFKDAYNFLQKKDSLQNILFNIEKEKSIQEIETKYQSEKNKKKIKTQDEELTKNKLVIENNRLTIALMLGGFLLFLILTFGYFNRQKHLKNQIERELKLKTAIQEIETQNKIQAERLRISRDLHDNIGSQLSFVVSSLDNLKFKSKEKNTIIEENIKEISVFTKNTITELRDTIWALNKEEIEIAHIKLRIQSFIDKAARTYPNINIHFISGDSNNLVVSSLKGINLLRVVQEAVNNALKHAHAQNINVHLLIKNAMLEILIKDDGIGFDLTTISGGYGLENMQIRVQELGGSFSVKTDAKMGTEIRATFFSS